MKTHLEGRKMNRMKKQKPAVYRATSGATTVALTPSSIALRVAMEFFEHRYYRFNKALMTLSGTWPYQSTRTKWSIFIFITFILISQVVPQALALVKYREEQAIVVSCITTFLFEAIWAAKEIGCLWNSQKVTKLLNCIRMDWQVWARDREVNIIHEYAEQGRKMSLAFTDLLTLHTAEMSSVVFVFMAQPTIPKIIDVLLKNGTAPGEFPTPVDYYHIDSQKYYFYIIMLTCVCHCVGVLCLMASEVMLIICVQHVCGVFAALGCKVQRIGNNNTSVHSGEMSYFLNKRDMVELASCIDRHNDAIDCANLIDATYTLTIFFVLGCGMTALTLVGLQILLCKSNPEDTVRFIGVALGSILHLFIMSYISQMLMNHSISIRLYIYDSRWYKLAPKAQKLVQLMIIRCSVPCKLTAGHFFILSMRTFAQSMRTVMSYFTVLRSMQI